MFLLLAIKVFGCLHQKVNGFSFGCANMVWRVKAYLRSSSFNFVFILQAKGVGGDAMSGSNLYVKVCCYCK
jgi:hypothetical protein